MFKKIRFENGKRQIFWGNKKLFSYFSPKHTLKHYARQVDRTAMESAIYNANWGGVESTTSKSYSNALA